jgi:hypothetical protein
MWPCVYLMTAQVHGLYRHAILNYQKSATYKLGLLRALCRAANGASGLAQDGGADHMAVPLGLVVALNWLRLYLPLIAADLPQTPTNRQANGLGFAQHGLRALLGGNISSLDLRIGAQFRTEIAHSVHAVLRDVAETIVRMPATHLTYPNGGRILPVDRKRTRLKPSLIRRSILITAFPGPHGPAAISTR